MEHKPIYVDGVDVKDCRRRIGKNSYCRYFKRLCSDNNVNCVWKQLARKKQECEIWKNQVLILDEEDVTVQVTQEQFEEYQKLKQELYFARNEVHSKTEYIREQRDIIDKLKQEYEQLQEKYEALKLENQEGYEIVAELKQECEELKKQLMQKSEVDMFFNTPIEGWSNDPCGICPHKAENEELKKEIINKNEKIKELRFSVSDLTNRLCYLNAEKSFRIVDLEQTLDGIEKELKEDIYCENQECGCDDFEECLKCTKEHILDIINKAKGEVQ